MTSFASRTAPGPLLSCACLLSVLALPGCNRGGGLPDVGDTPVAKDRMDLVELKLPAINLAQEPPGKASEQPGLVVKVHAEGEGDAIRYGMIGRFHYIGTFANGRTFQNTYEREAEYMRLLPPAVPKGLALALHDMKLGERRGVRVPAALAYGEEGEPMRGIPPHALLQYDIELVEVVRGLELGVMKEGTGAVLEHGQTGRFLYTGVFKKDGRVFDSATEPYERRIGVGSVIPGWDLGLPGMKVGEKRRLGIPSALAYGELGQPGQQGRAGIPPNTDLVFEVELIGINP